MTIDSMRAKIIANLWQAIAQSDVDLSSLAQADQEKLISRMADQMMITFDSFLDETVDVQKADEEPVPVDNENEFDEKILWQGRPFLSLVEHYTVTNERLKIVRGFISRDIENFELIRVQDIDVTQALHERALNIGDIHIHGQDPSHPTAVLRNVSNPEKIYEMLRKAWLEARKRHGLQFQEFM